MPLTIKQKQRLAKTAFLIVVIGIVAILAFSLGGKRDMAQTGIEEPIDNEDADAHIVISKFHQTSTKDGVVEWSLDADTAMMNQETKNATFKNVSVTFFLEEDNKVYLTADTGSLELESKNMDIRGNVVVTSQDYVMKTDEMNYRHELRTFSSTGPVQISGGSSELLADSLTFNLDTNQALFDGQVRGTFGEAIAL